VIQQHRSVRYALWLWPVLLLISVVSYQPSATFHLSLCNDIYFSVSWVSTEGYVYLRTTVFRVPWSFELRCRIGPLLWNFCGICSVMQICSAFWQELSFSLNRLTTSAVS